MPIKASPTELDQYQAQAALSSTLVGWTINQLVYHITGWELRLSSPSCPNDAFVIAADMQLGGTPDQTDLAKHLPQWVFETNEPEHGTIALALFSVINRYPISNCKVSETGDLTLNFENGVGIVLPAIVELVDWTWSVRVGGSNYNCDSGLIFKSTAPAAPPQSP